MVRRPDVDFELIHMKLSFDAFGGGPMQAMNMWLRIVVGRQSLMMAGQRIPSRGSSHVAEVDRYWWLHSRGKLMRLVRRLVRGRLQ